MRPKKIEKQQALQMRKRGHTLPEIARKLNVSKSSCSIWFRGLEISISAKAKIEKRKLLARENAFREIRNQRNNRDQAARLRAQTTINNISINKDIAKLICAMLYWSEGEKNRRTIAFVNSDPTMIKTFLFLFRKSFKVNESKFRAQLHLHTYHDKTKQLCYWSNLTGIPKKQFYVYNKPNTGINKKDGYPGCLSVRYYDVTIAMEIESLYKLLAKKLSISKNCNTTMGA